MKLSDVKLKIINGKPFLVRLNKKGKVITKISCAFEFNEQVVKNYNDVWLKHDGKHYLCVIREASREQIAIYNIEQKKREVIAKARGRNAFIKWQRRLKALYSSLDYDNEKMEMLREIAKTSY